MSVANITTEKIEYFKNRFPKPYSESLYVFACQAAIPLLLSPDLLYNLWNNFKSYFYNGKYETIPYYAVSDLLLSSLCRPVGYKLYKMDEEVRTELRRKQKIDTATEEQIAYFLLQYAERSKTATSKNIYEIHNFAAQYILNAQKLAEEIYNDLVKENKLKDYDKVNLLHVYFQLQTGSETDKGYKIVLQEVESNTQEEGILRIKLPQHLRRLVNRLAFSISEIETEFKVNMTRLSNEEIDFTPLKNVYVLDNTTNELIGLALRGNSIKNISFLKKYESLNKLYLTDNEISDLSPLQNLINISVLDLEKNKISDITVLEHLTNLITLNLLQNKVEDFTVLNKLQRLRSLVSDCVNKIDLKTPYVDKIDFKTPRESVSQNIINGDDRNRSIFITGVEDKFLKIQINVNESGVLDVFILSCLNCKIHIFIDENTKICNFYPVNVENSFLFIVQKQDSKIEKYINPNRFLNSRFMFINNEIELKEHILPYFNDYDEEIQNRIKLLYPEIVIKSQIIQELEDKAGITLTPIDFEKIGYTETKNAYSINENDELIGLNLRSNGLKDISFLENFTTLKKLYLGNNEISDLTPIILLTQLQSLGLNKNKISKITELSGLINLRKLFLKGNNIQNISPLQNLTNLTELVLEENPIVDSFVIKQLINLTDLNLEHTGLSNISFLSGLRNLRKLDLEGNTISDISPLKDLKNLKKLDLRNNQIKELPECICDLGMDFYWDNSAKGIGLEGNPIEIPPIEIVKQGKEKIKYWFKNNKKLIFKDIEVLFQLSELLSSSFTKVDISDFYSNEDNPIRFVSKEGNVIALAINKMELSAIPKLIVDNAHLFENLEILDISNNQITDISPIKELKNLTKLDLRNNQIKELPEWICDLRMDFYWGNSGEGIGLKDNPIENVPIDVIKQGKAAIKAWFEGQKKIKSIPNPYVKLIVVGNTTVGKTSFINFLTNQTFTEGEITTHGINQKLWKPTNTNLDVSIWEFGGQEFYHSTHQLFFSNNCLYLLMFDKQHNCNGWLQTEIDYADKGKVTEELEHFDYFYWLRNIRNLSDKSKILMLQNKVENIKDRVFPSNEIFDENLEYKVEDYQATSVLNAYNYYKENQKLSYEFEELRNLIISKLNEVKRGEIFEYYLKAKELIETAALIKPVVSIAEFIEICKPANANIANLITDSDGNETEYTAWKLMCVYFHETGVLLYYPDSPTLKNKIFIRPTFITDSIYKVLNYKVKQAFGRFTLADAVQSLDNDSVLAKDIIELISAPNFKLIFNYPQGSDKYIAPQYMDDKQPDERFFTHLTKKMEIGFILEFTQFLPKHILTEFIVNFGRFQKDDVIWKYGIVFEKYGTTAFVECLFNERKIIYKSDNLGDHARLKFKVFETIININRNSNNLNISLYPDQKAYNLEVVLSDFRNTQFELFRTGYQKYKETENERYQTIIDGKQIKIEGNGNIILQDVSGQSINININDLSKIKEKLSKENSTLLILLKQINETISKTGIYDIREQIMELFEQNFLKSDEKKLDNLIEKKLHIEEELITTYDSEKKFAFQQQIKELEEQIAVLKQKTIDVSGNNNIVRQDVKDAEININIPFPKDFLKTQKFIKDKGYQPLGNPNQKIQPLFLYEKEKQGIFKNGVLRNTNSNLNDLLINDYIAIKITEEKTPDIFSSHKIEPKSVSNIFTSSNIEIHNLKSVVLNFEKTTVTEVHLIELDSWLRQAKLNEKTPTYIEKLKQQLLYVVTSVLKAQKLIFKIERETEGKPSIKLTQTFHNLKHEVLNEKEEQITYENEDGFIFGVKLVRLKFSPKGILTIDNRQDFNRVLGENIDADFYKTNEGLVDIE